MTRNLFQQLTLSELEKYTSELELAVENHAKWLSRINRTLICSLPADSNDLSEHPHQLCQLGRWYQQIEEPGLTADDTFRYLGEVHKAMHMTAKSLLLKQQTPHEQINPDEYDELIELSEELRFLINALRREFNHNRNLTAKLMGKVFENASEGVIITAPDTTIISVNKAFSEVTGYSAEEAIGQKPNMLHSGKQDEAFYQRMWDDLRREGQWQGEIWNCSKDGEIYLEWLSVTAVKDESSELTHYIGIFTDITSEKENEERLAHLAHYDQLTNLPNRILFDDRLKQALSLARRSNSKLAVMFLDLDGFKAINDNLGHNSGDRLLQQVAERLNECLRKSDTVARFGGDEFTILLSEIDSKESVIKIATKIIEAIAEPYDIDGCEASVTTSIGISLYPADGQQAQTLVKKADNAMYNAKRLGKNHHQFYS